MEQVREPRVLRNLSLIGFVGAFFEPLLGIVLGHIALYEYTKTEGAVKSSRGFAIAGLVIGYAGLFARFVLLSLMFLAGMALSI